jgi:hypothetical protein
MKSPRLASLLCLLFLLFRPAFGAGQEEVNQYAIYDMRTSRIILEQLTCLDESVNSLQRWVEREFTGEQALSEAAAYRGKIEKSGRELKALKVSPELFLLQGTLVRCSGEMELLASQVGDRIKKTNLDSVDDLRALLVFLREFSFDLFRIQKRMAVTSLETQKNWDFSEEKAPVQEYYRWNTPLSAIALQEMDLFSAFQELLYRVMDGFQTSEALQLAGKNLLAQSLNLKKKAEAIKPSPRLAELHRSYLEYLSDMISMMGDMNGLLESPGLDKLKALESKASLISEKSLDFSRSCIAFMENNFTKR